MFDYQSDCFLSYNTMHTGVVFFFFVHRNIRYICLVQIFDPINKICIITITNFTNNKSIYYNSQKVPSLARLDRDRKNRVAPLYNSLFTQWWKKTQKNKTKKLRRNTSALETQSLSVTRVEAVIDKLDTSYDRCSALKLIGWCNAASPWLWAYTAAVF